MFKSILLSTILISSVAMAVHREEPTLEKCLARFAEDYVPEHNNPNDYIISTDKKARTGVLDVIKSNRLADWMIGFSESSLMFADAVGVVFQYSDEIHMIFASVNVEGGKCQVRELADINIVDVDKQNDQTLLAKYFLGLPKNKLPGTARDWVYDDIKSKLAGTE